MTGAAQSVCVALLLGINPFLVVAAAQAPDHRRSDSPVASARRVTGTIHLDGLLDEPDWSATAPIGALTQREPLEGQPASEQTDVRVLFDEQALYIGIVSRVSSRRHRVESAHARRESRR